MIFGHFPKGLALLLMHILEYFYLIIFGHFPKGLALLLMHILVYCLFNHFWALSKKG